MNSSSVPQERKWPPPVTKRPPKGRGAVMRERSLDLQDRQRQEARRRLLAAKRAASFRQSSVTERADSIEIYIPEAQTRLWNTHILCLTSALHQQGTSILLHVTAAPVHILTSVTSILPLLIIYSELRIVVSLYMPQTELNAKRSWQSMHSKTCSYCNPVCISVLVHSEAKTKALFTLHTNPIWFSHPIFRTHLGGSCNSSDIRISTMQRGQLSWHLATVLNSWDA